MKLFIIAGEASGDLHGSNLILELKQLNQNIDIKAWGGDLMQKAGADILKHYEELAFMGFVEVVLNIRTIKANFKKCRKDIEEYQPDVVLMIDYPGFNLRLAPFIKKKNIPIVYYISPQIWAWKQSRIHQIKALVDKMLVILPFEKDFYKKFGVDVDFVGHPLIDAITNDANKHDESDKASDKILALLPGSRKQEISKMLPIMLDSAKEFPDFTPILAGAPGIPNDFYNGVIGADQITIHRGGTYPLLKNSHMALVTSGTATLESALLKVPEVVCYKGNYISYLIAKKLVKVKYISLVNLIMDESIVKELIQKSCNKTLIVNELKKLESGVSRKTMLNDFDRLEAHLGGAGASRKAAEAVFKTLQLKTSESTG
ncbi:MAG: lipid-A-disaccharide synthase [Patiriisocius sp.]|jgi:lipid-A-disaccharide synthase